MPCATVHLDAAGRVLDRWKEDPSGSPFDASRADLATAFLQGSVAPDMGYVPGVDRFVSDLAHYIRSVDLTRSLVDRAEDPRQEAFAWGWATHVLADILIHPLVGRACGELLYGSRELRLNSGADLAAHVGMEVGLDGEILISRRGVPAPPPVPSGAPHEAKLLAEALGRIYDLDWNPRFLEKSQRRAARLNQGWPTALRVVNGRLEGEVSGGVGVDIPASGGGLQFGEPPEKSRRGRFQRITSFAASALGRFAAPGTPAFGFLRPLRPPRWLVSEVLETLGQFPERFQDLVSGGLTTLENHNLESGVPESSGVQHPEALKTQVRLKSVRAGRSPAAGLVATAAPRIN